jgi:ankyrin repeat protein
MIEDGANSQSALEWAWCKMLGNTYEPKTMQEFRAIFTDRECLEEFGFSHLHKLVLNLEPGDLASLLPKLTAEEINAVDFGGRTSLSWASQRGDLSAVTALLSHNADPNLTTPKGMSPLHYASEALTPSCISPLLAHGADIHATDHALHTALHFACAHRDDAAYLSPLIGAGADVEVRTDYDYTPLIDALQRDSVASARYLLDHGASVDTRGQYGKTPLMYAVEYNSHACLRLLLSRNADWKLESEIRGPTVVHFVAEHADLETVEILNAYEEHGVFSLESLEMDVLGLEVGMGIVGCVGRRLREEDGIGVGFREAFGALVEKVIDPRDLKAGELPEVWEDAVEEQVKEVRIELCD